jgi:EAL domain-containing protein (putative c-di-GMP-specific phosphodiesterase class I)/DNA-binding NarL/FixJ family response regulator
VVFDRRKPIVTQAATAVKPEASLQQSGALLKDLEPGRRLRVLVAADEEQARRTLADLVSGEESLELVGLARDSQEAVEFSVRESPDVALIDLRMPGGGAPEVVLGIRRCSPVTRVVVLSADSDPASVLRMLRAGAESYALRGATASEIVRALHDAVLGRGAIVTEVVRRMVDRLVPFEEDGNAPGRSASRVLRALEGEGLEMVFQPIVDLGRGDIVGYEALARFRGGSETSPEVLFAEAEGMGLGLELELATVRSALGHLELLPASCFLSVNASPRTAASPRLLNLLDGWADRLVLEITEHAPVRDYPRLSGALAQLRSAGVRVAVDDAGAGFAGIDHVLKLEPDFVKLDISLIRGIDRDETRRAVASALLELARTVNSTVVAEGIEREPELRALRGLGVSLGQGFHLARPVPAERLLGLPPIQVASQRRSRVQPHDRARRATSATCLPAVSS